VRIEQLVKLCRGDRQDRRACRLGRARTIDENVDAAEFADARIDQRVGDSGVGGRTGEPYCAATNAFHGFGHGRFVAPVDDDVRAKGAKEFGDGQPDAAGATDDDGTAAGELLGQIGSSWPNFMASMFQ
jgi:hypothetical protein